MPLCLCVCVCVCRYIGTEMDVYFLSFFYAVGHALDAAVTDFKKHTGTAKTEDETHTLITEVYGNSRLGTQHNKTVLDYV